MRDDILEHISYPETMDEKKKDFLTIQGIPYSFQSLLFLKQISSFMSDKDKPQVAYFDLNLKTKNQNKILGFKPLQT